MKPAEERELRDLLRRVVLERERERAAHTGKLTYSSKKEALKVSRQQYRRKRIFLQVYRCQYCGLWHLGEVILTDRTKTRRSLA